MLIRAGYIVSTSIFIRVGARLLRLHEYSRKYSLEAVQKFVWDKYLGHGYAGRHLVLLR